MELLQVVKTTTTFRIETVDDVCTLKGAMPVPMVYSWCGTTVAVEHGFRSSWSLRLQHLLPLPAAHAQQASRQERKM